METQVVYDDTAKEFVINSPTVLSQKYWISNGFKHANHALVFGQTLVAGISMLSVEPSFVGDEGSSVEVATRVDAGRCARPRDEATSSIVRPSTRFGTVGRILLLGLPK